MGKPSDYQATSKPDASEDSEFKGIPQPPTFELDLETNDVNSSVSAKFEKSKVETIEQLPQQRDVLEELEQNVVSSVCACSQGRQDILSLLRAMGLSTNLTGIYDQNHMICHDCTLFVDKELKKEQQVAEPPKMVLAPPPGLEDCRQEHPFNGTCLAGTAHELNGNSWAGSAVAWREISNQWCQGEEVHRSYHDTLNDTHYQGFMTQMAMQPVVDGGPDFSHQMPMKQMTMHQMASEMQHLAPGWWRVEM